MATRRIVVGALVLYLLVLCRQLEAVLPGRVVFGSKATNLGTALKSTLDDVTEITKLVKEYDDNKVKLQFETADGSSMVAEMANNIGAMLSKKMVALRDAVTFAEAEAAKYEWNGDLKKGDITYQNAKEVNISLPEYEYSEKFKQKVSNQTSSVHIPVEIYEGEMRQIVPKENSFYTELDILNDLAWTSSLEDVWIKNRDRDPDLLWQFFGSQSGIMRAFPASEWQGDGEVDLYDVRRRPWYTQGASSPKDMLILVDTSGSTHGQALALMKQSVKSLLDTLGENDFVNVAHFDDKANWIGCFSTFVQANQRNKKRITQAVDEMTAKGVASYRAGLEFAFEAFIKFGQEAQPQEGARCNRVIMFLTDGGTEMPEDVFKQYNWPKKKKVPTATLR